MSLKIPPKAVVSALASLDGSNAPLDEVMIHQAIVDAAPGASMLDEGQRRAVAIELFAFEAVGQTGRASSWGTYFGPLATGTHKDGSFWQVPEPATANAAYVEHWSARATLVQHPVMKARYADIAWDLARLLGAVANVADARLAIDAYIASTDRKTRDNMHARLSAAVRALDLSIMLKDTARTDRARERLLALHAESVQAEDGLWWIAPDRLLGDKRFGLLTSDTNGLIADLEALVVRYGDVSDLARFNPHQQEAAALILRRHYARQGSLADQRRLTEAVARTYEEAAATVTPLIAPTFLQKAVTSFRDAGLRDESERTRVKMQEAIRASHDAMKEIGGTFKIKDEDVRAFIQSTVVDDLGRTLALIAGQFLSSRPQLESQLRDVAKVAPLQSMINISVTQDDHVAAIIGSLDADPMGRLVHQAHFSFNVAELWLMEALGAAIERHGLTAAHITGWANRHRLFDDLEFIYEGLDAWFKGNLIQALHILVPQVEKGLRAIAAKLGHPVTKPAPATPNASVPINMADILTNEKIAVALGEDITLHFRALYSDPRGMNLRNRVAHGSFSPKLLGPHVLRLVVHSLLVLGIWEELAAARKKKAAL